MERAERALTEAEAEAEPQALTAGTPLSADLHSVAGVLALQRTAGNRSVALAIARQRHGRSRWTAANPIGRPHPPRAPTAAELLADPVVIAAMRHAWILTRADEPGRSHAVEQGGFIYMDLATGNLIVWPADPRAPNDPRGTYGINLNNPKVWPGAVLVGRFHTHPTGSPHDELDTVNGLPEFVVQGAGVVDTYGQPVRAGDWSRAADEPLFPR